jgi:hypothetical protein
MNIQEIDVGHCNQTLDVPNNGKLKIELKLKILYNNKNLGFKNL